MWIWALAWLWSMLASWQPTKLCHPAPAVTGLILLNKNRHQSEATCNRRLLSNISEVDVKPFTQRISCRCHKIYSCQTLLLAKPSNIRGVSASEKTPRQSSCYFTAFSEFLMPHLSTTNFTAFLIYESRNTQHGKTIISDGSHKACNHGRSQIHN